MANPLKKTLAYLGLAEEEEYGYDETPAQPTERNQREERAARDERPTRDEVAEQAPAPVTPLRRPAVVRQPAASVVNEIVTVHPKQYRDAPVIAEHFRDGVPVIINLSQMSDADARRLIDFASGLSIGLYGKFERVTSKVFLLSPENIAISGDGGIARVDDDTSFTQN